MTKEEFKCIAAADAVHNTYPGAKTWPLNNVWALVSTIKDRISDSEVEKLKKAYNIDKFEDEVEKVTKQ